MKLAEETPPPHTHIFNNHFSRIHQRITVSGKLLPIIFHQKDEQIKGLTGDTKSTEKLLVHKLEEKLPG